MKKLEISKDDPLFEAIDIVLEDGSYNNQEDFKFAVKVPLSEIVHSYIRMTKERSVVKSLVRAAENVLAVYAKETSAERIRQREKEFEK